MRSIPQDVAAALAAKLLARSTSTDTGCLVLQRPQRSPYPYLRMDGVPYKAHRIMYTHVVGPIPVGLELDHLCRNPGCFNPDHLEPVTHAENVRRGIAPAADNARKQACPQGHPYVRTDSRGRRICGERHGPAPAPRPQWRHGTKIGYFRHGCRCDYCKAARKRFLAGLPDDDPRHGTPNGYVNCGCRCDACRTAWAVYQKQRRAAKAA